LYHEEIGELIGIRTKVVGKVPRRKRQSDDRVSSREYGGLQEDGAQRRPDLVGDLLLRWPRLLDRTDGADQLRERVTDNDLNLLGSSGAPRHGSLLRLRIPAPSPRAARAAAGSRS